MPTHAKTDPMNAPLRKPWTQDEFFSWAERQEGRYEFDGVQPVAMTGGSLNHDRIIGSLQVALRTRLRGGRCEPFGPNAGVDITHGAIRYPDALVTCSKVEGNARTVPGVVVVFEVLSPSSGATDRVLKLREYATVSTIRRYVILESNSIGIQVFERTSPEQHWQAAGLTSGDTLYLPEIGIEIPVDEVYDGIEFAEQDNQEG